MMYVKIGDGDTVAFDHSFTVGRGNDQHHPDITIGDDTYVSVLHAGFTHDGEGWRVQDMGSSNGTYLNDVTPDGNRTYAKEARVHGPALLRRGDKVRVGMTVLTVVPVHHETEHLTERNQHA